MLGLLLPDSVDIDIPADHCVVGVFFNQYPQGVVHYCEKLRDRNAGPLALPVHYQLSVDCDIRAMMLVGRAGIA
jgi:hypothetical protein